ncbi:ataxin-2-like protein [Cucumis melo var. makuwa]|uniref:Ataxin-2-like protein n=1 Tax=Cucumis melo var. makuwa TaxID=1194695 RepID=A0A5D3DXZ5_CUCMM|nr:ataxin-2-like protein [Cucumis melo var. makuwa]
MDPSPPAIATTAAAANFAPNSMQHQQHHNYQDSIESSPRSHNADWDDPLPPVPGAKLRLMCSYGGHIIPRPHDKSLCYVGGDTRIVVVDRHSTLSDLCMRLSRTLLNGRPFTLKYQLPHEDLDSLISIATDEDLENMIEEYDRITMASPSKPLRIRLFLFFIKPETAASMGSLLDDAKHETWFVDALNNSAGMIPRGLSDSATMECMVNLDAVRTSDSCNDLENQGHDSLGHIDKQVVKISSSAQDVQSIPDSPAVENDSSFGSSSSVPSMSNLPPIRVRVEETEGRVQDPKVGLEEQFGQMNFGVPPIPTALAAAAATVPLGVISNQENANRVYLDDERPEQVGTVAFRKPPLPLQTLQNRGVASPVVSGGFGLPSPDSVASDSSIASANSQSKPIYFHDQIMRDNQVPATPITESDGFLTSQQVPIQHLHDPTYLLTSQLDQKQPQQFVHTATHYIHHHHPAAAAGHVPVQQYYHPIYTPTPSQQQLHHPIDQQYPVYLMPITQTQPTYNMSVQSSPAETPLAVPNRQASASPAIVSSSIVYNDSSQPSLYPQKVTAAMPEMAANVYRTAVTSNPPPLLQVPHNQFQQPYVGLPQMNYPSQSLAVAPAPTPSGTANYGFDYTNAPPQNIPATPMASQYQTMTQAAAAALSDASRQLPVDGTQQQQVRNS